MIKLPWHFGKVVQRVGMTVACVTILMAPPTQAASPAPEHAAMPPGQIMTPAVRVATIGYHLATANAARCPAHAMLTGLVLHDRSAYAERARAGLPGLGWGFGVLGVVKGSPADEAELRNGDEIVAVDGQDMRNFGREAVNAQGSFTRTEAFTNLLAAWLDAGPVRVRIARGEREIDAIVRQQTGCAVAFTLVPGSTPDAWTDGRYLAVSTSLENRADDSALAFAMAHELAHVALAHTKRPERPFAAFGIGAGSARKEEVEADRLAVHLMAAAGYDPARGAHLFDVLRQSSPLRFGLNYPSMRSRIAALDEEIKRLSDRP
jgi:hypothetical protein